MHCPHFDLWCENDHFDCDVKIIILIVMMKVTIASCLKCVDIFQSVAAMHCSIVYFCIVQCISVNCTVYFCELCSVFLWIAQCISVKYTVYLCAVQCISSAVQFLAVTWGQYWSDRSSALIYCTALLHFRGKYCSTENSTSCQKSQDNARAHHSNTFGIHYSPLHWEQGAV